MTGDPDSTARRDRFAGYRRARVLIEDLDGRDLVLRPVTPDPDTPGPDTLGPDARNRPSGAPDPKSLPFPCAAPAHVITAANPGAAVLDDATNAERHDQLVRGLRADGHVVRRTVASDGAGGHGEVGVLVAGLSDADARAWGRGFGQDAVFGWDPDRWSVLPCDGSPATSTGWSLRPASP